jgi:hypothetical protein
VVAKDGINLQRTITMGKPLISGSVTRPFYEFGGTKLVQNFQTICKLLIYMLKNGGQGRNCSALHAFRNSSKRHFVESKIRSNHLSCKMLGIHGASWHFLTPSSLVSPETIGVSPFPRRIANISMRSMISVVPVLARASPGEYERRGGAPLEKILASRGMGADG